ncbi:MAG: alpha/beta hydrolase [Candidatus Sumerlaeota bacterium]|nr:alpha/beta hydrolase [Candidatus Sumerlaeota bacterium]
MTRHARIPIAFLALACAALLAFAGSAFAQGEPASAPKKAAGAKASQDQLQKLLKRSPDADANGDGKLTIDEAMAYRKKQKVGAQSSEEAASQGASSQPAESKAARKKAAVTDLPADLVLERDLTYGEGPNAQYQTLDILYHKDTSKRRPAIVMVHGGGFRGGDKATFLDRVAYFGKLGYVTMTINYRLTGVAPFPAQVEDCKQAVRWLRANAAKYGVDPEHIGALGGSAGAHLAAMLALVPKSAGLEGDGPYQDQSSRVQAAVPISGAFDFRPDSIRRTGMQVDDVALVPFLGGTADEKPDLAAKASPITYIAKDEPPLLIIHGTADKRIDVRQAEEFGEALKKIGADYELVIMEGAGHVPNIPSMPEYEAKVEAFFAKNLKLQAEEKE